MDPVEQAKSEMGGLESFFSKIPGIAGYRAKEMRRDADKQLRDALAQRLESRRRKLTGLQSDLLDSGGILWMDDMERVVGRLQLLIDRVKTASYGYAPLFALNRVALVLTLRTQRTYSVGEIRDGEVVTWRTQSAPQSPFILRALYFLLIGWWLSLIWSLLGWLLCVTIIGLPLGVLMLNRLPAVTTLMRH